jgi:saccharopine dehydrogenase-like NADP-dependent oxidoreductase
MVFMYVIAAVEAQIKTADLVISLLPASQHLPIAQMCIAKVIIAVYMSCASH